MTSSSGHILLLHPPYGDMTYPYHAVSYVAAPLRHAGYQVEVLDMNAIWFRHVFRKAYLADIRQHVLTLFDELNGHEAWDLPTQHRAYELLHALVTCDCIDPEELIEVFQSEVFYDFKQYSRARNLTQKFTRLLNLTHAPYDFAGAFERPAYPSNLAELCRQVNASDRLRDEMSELLKANCEHGDYLFCGVSMPFTSHVVPGFVLMDALQGLFPEAVLVAGGTAISDIFKAAGGVEKLRALGSLCDIVYLGEAELGVVELAAACADRRNPLPSQAHDLNHCVGELDPAPAHYVAMSASASPHRPPKHAPYDWRACPPVYDWVDWSLYLAPVKQINYSPARGCFWNKCTFCDYGLNSNLPTAPSRTMSVDVVVEHLWDLNRAGIRYVYFAVDAIAPTFLIELADRLIDEKLDVRWSTELFLTRSFDHDTWRKLEASGLITASFGLESGSSRVLESMGKGAQRVERVLTPVFQAIRDTGIGMQPKYFFGFPGEKDSDRQKTVDLLHAHQDVFSVLTKANVFDLTEGSQVAKQPEKYGLTNIRRRAGDDIGGGLIYDVVGDQDPPRPADFEHFNRQIHYPPMYERPWAGGIDTLHSKLYLERFGRNIFHRLAQDDTPANNGSMPSWSASIDCHFDLEEVIVNVQLDRVISTDPAGGVVDQILGNGKQRFRDDLQTAVQRESQAFRYTVVLN